MKREERFPNTKWFTYENVNPKKKITGDCVIRALSNAMNKPWEEVFNDLFNLSLKTGYMLDTPNLYKKYLEEQGWKIQKQPKYAFTGTKYTGREFIDKLVRNTTIDGKPIIAHIGTHHLSCIINNTIRDIWDCSNDKVGNYWIKC